MHEKKEQPFFICLGCYLLNILWLNQYCKGSSATHFPGNSNLGIFYEDIQTFKYERFIFSISS